MSIESDKQIDKKSLSCDSKTSGDKKLESNVNHFYNCKFVIKSREGSKSTNKGRES